MKTVFVFCLVAAALFSLCIYLYRLFSVGERIKRRAIKGKSIAIQINGKGNARVLAVLIKKYLKALKVDEISISLNGNREEETTSADIEIVGTLNVLRQISPFPARIPVTRNMRRRESTYSFEFFAEFGASNKFKSYRIKKIVRGPDKAPTFKALNEMAREFVDELICIAERSKKAATNTSI